MIVYVLSIPIAYSDLKPHLSKRGVGSRLIGSIKSIPAKISHNTSAAVHRGSEKHFIYGEIHRQNAIKAEKAAKPLQATKNNVKSILSYGKSAAYSKAGQATKTW